MRWEKVISPKTSSFCRRFNIQILWTIWYCKPRGLQKPKWRPTNQWTHTISLCLDGWILFAYDLLMPIKLLCSPGSVNVFFLWSPIESSKQIRAKQRTYFLSTSDNALVLIVDLDTIYHLSQQCSHFWRAIFLFSWDINLFLLKIKTYCLPSTDESLTESPGQKNVELLLLPIVIVRLDYVKGVPMWGQCFLLWRLVLE